MGRIARVIQTAIEKYITQTVESYMGANSTVLTFGPSGEDSPPLPEDRVILVPVDGKGTFVAAGVLSLSQGAKAGEKIFYSRDENGEVKAVVKLLQDGSISVSGSGASLTVDGTCSVSIKGGDISVDGDCTINVSGNCAIGASKFTVGASADSPDFEVN